jgi:hypothetical protein
MIWSIGGNFIDITPYHAHRYPYYEGNAPVKSLESQFLEALRFSADQLKTI